jgi:hypothetical protein
MKIPAAVSCEHSNKWFGCKRWRILTICVTISLTMLHAIKVIFTHSLCVPSTSINYQHGWRQPSFGRLCSSTVMCPCEQVTFSRLLYVVSLCSRSTGVSDRRWWRHPSFWRLCASTVTCPCEPTHSVACCTLSLYLYAPSTVVPASQYRLLKLHTYFSMITTLRWLWAEIPKRYLLTIP